MKGIAQGIVSLLQDWQGTSGFELKTCNHELFNIQMPHLPITTYDSWFYKQPRQRSQNMPIKKWQVMLDWDNFIFKHALRNFHLLKAFFFCPQWKHKA